MARSLTKDESTSTYMTPQQRMANGLTSRETAQLPSTLDQNSDIPHQGLVVVAGHSFSLHCSSPVSTKFSWGYCRLGSRNVRIIGGGTRISERFHLADRIGLSNCDDRRCTLNVRALELDDAGFFACMRRDNRYWSITLLSK